MHRLPAVIVALGVTIAALGTGIVLLADGDGAVAFTVNGHGVPQRTVDADLRALADNRRLAAALTAAGSEPIATSPGAIRSDVSAGWIQLLVGQEAAAQDVEREGLEVTASDRATGRLLAENVLFGERVFRAFPEWFRDRTIRQWTSVAVGVRAMIEQSGPKLTSEVVAQCPSGRFVAHILVSTRGDADAIKAQLGTGADFAAVAKQRSQDESTVASGGNLGCLDRIQGLPTEVTNAAQGQPLGVASDPVQTPSGVHVLLVRNQPSETDVVIHASNQVLQSIANDRIEIDPRYGRWNRRAGTIDLPRDPAPPAEPTVGG